MVVPRRRPRRVEAPLRQPLGPLMVAAAFALLPGSSGTAATRSSSPSSSPSASSPTPSSLMSRSPTLGARHDRLERGFLGAAYTVALVFPLAILLFHDGSERSRTSRVPRESLLLVSGTPMSSRRCRGVRGRRYGVLASFFVVLIARRLVTRLPERADPRAVPACGRGRRPASGLRQRAHVRRPAVGVLYASSGGRSSR